MHDTRYKLCDECREFRRNLSRERKGYKIPQVIKLCELHDNLEVCRDILAILNDGK